MGLSEASKKDLTNTLINCLRHKFKNYRPETENMPFHYRLLGKDRMALFSFIQSLNTTFGVSIYEPVAIALAKDRFKNATYQAPSKNMISMESQKSVEQILNNLIIGRNQPDKLSEFAMLRESSQKGEMAKVKLRKYDVLLEDKQGNLFAMDIKTVKPNITDFESYKRQLLNWTAAELTQNPSVQFNAYIAIPYNPYEPASYKRWTMQGIFDVKGEVLVANEMWNFIGGDGAYEDMLDCFETAGLELRPEIDSYFAKFKT